jgi:uncharacterized flavoprotein (TIGR03862 family)
MDGEKSICVVGGGPAGLMAAETAVLGGASVTLCDAMPSVGRKFLLAGKGGLNLTHSEPLAAFALRYGENAELFLSLFNKFGPAELRSWAADLGVATFVGSSGRVFPAEFKAAPLLRAWVRRLRSLGVIFRKEWRWIDFADDGTLRFHTSESEQRLTARATILALGGASWPQLGSDGSWIEPLRSIGCRISPLRPANCGFLVNWSPFMVPHFGYPLKSIALSFGERRLRGEILLSDYGLEGSGLYAMSAALRDAIARNGRTTLTLDLKPDLDTDALRERLKRPRGRQSLSNWLRRAINLSPAAIALLRELAPKETSIDQLVPAIKALPLPLAGVRPIAEAISSAGGLCFDEVNEDLMVQRRPGLFVAGEMLDWEAPTGGYLLTGCFATGRQAGQGALRWLVRC